MGTMDLKESVSTKLAWIAELARRHRETAHTTLAHHIDTEFLQEAYRLTRKNGAVGIDDETAAQYAENLTERLAELKERFKAGTYRAPPVRRVYIPKGDGGQRPIGIPTFEDKVLQRAVAMVVGAVYEQEFLDCSYGFRPGRSAHQALQTLWQGVMKMGGGWVVDVDIKGYYDTINHEHLRSFLDRRIRDGVIRRVINKWLKAGVMEEGELVHPEHGTPQGGVISPVLANIFLHEVVDRWFAEMVLPNTSGQAFMVRYADDIVMVFKQEGDAKRMMQTLPKRLGKYGLAVSPLKTRLVPFTRDSLRETPRALGSIRGTFDFLGFTHYWGTSRKGRPVVKQKTAKKRLAAAIKRVAEWCRIYRHLKVQAQWKALCSKVRGHYNYYGITGNHDALSKMLHQVRRSWRYWLDRRSQRGRMDWERFARLLTRYPLPKPSVVHSVYLCVAKP